MTTTINVLIDENGLLNKESLQRMVNRKALELMEKRKRLEKETLEKVEEQRRASGQDTKTGEPLPIAAPARGKPGDPRGNNRIDQDPAANRQSGGKFIDISVIDEDDGYGAETASSEWLEYREKYPKNIFVMFRPIDPQFLFTEWKEPPGFLSDPNVYIINVSREPSQSDWYAELRNRNLVSRFKYVHIIIDNSGSMSIYDVQSSMDLFAEKINNAGKKFLRRPVPESDWQDMRPGENWIRAHIDVDRERPNQP